MSEQIMYCTVEDMLIAFDEYEIIRTSNDDGDDLSGVNTDIIEELIAEASSYINTFLAGRYSLPLSSVPPIIRNFAELFTLRLLKRRKGNSLTDELKTAIEQANQHLKDIHSGRTDLYESLSDDGNRIFALYNENSFSYIDRGRLKDL